VTLRSCLVSAFVIGMLAAGGGDAFAQASGGGAGSSRPYRGLFGGKPPDPVSRQSLSFMVSLAEGYNDDTSPRVSTVVDPNAGQASGLQTMLVADGAYSWRGTKLQFAVNGVSAFAYYNDLSETRSLSHSIGIGFNAQLSPKTSLLVNQSAAFTPSYLYGLFPGDDTIDPGDEVPAAPEYSVQTRDSYFYNTSLGLSHNFTVRNRLSLSGDFNYTDYVREFDTQRDMQVAGFRGQFSRNVKRNTVLAAGYRLRNGDVGIAFEPTTEQGIDIGVDHSRPLSATRRAFFGFRVGATTMEVPLSTFDSIAAQTGRRYFVDGQVSAGYQFSRGWQTRAMYRRAMEYVPTLTEPVFTDGASVNVDGMINRRFDLTASAGYSTGESAFTRDTSALKTYSGDVRFRYALNRTLAAYVQYLYYFYELNNAQLAPGMASRLERNAVRAGFMLWLPVVQR
jgi:hypothetical protein